MKNKIILPALMIKQPIGELYIAKAKASEILGMTYADIRAISESYRETYLGIQRKLDPRREREIAKYVKNVDATFPTSIVVYIDEEHIDIEKNGDHGAVNITIYNIDDKIAKIIDGQHRLAGLQKAIDDAGEKVNRDGMFDEGASEELRKLEDFEVSLTILIGMDIAEQANVFSKVNLTQTKVNKSLVYDLEEYSKIKAPYKTAHNVVVALNSTKESPFYKKIKRLGYVQFGEEIITQQTIVEALTKLFLSSDPEADRDTYSRNQEIRFTNKDLEQLPFRKLFADGKDIDIAKIMFNYFTAVQKRWPTAWGNKDYLLSKNSAFRALMKYLRDVYLQLNRNNFEYIPTVQEFSDILAKQKIKDEEFTSEHFKMGEMGMNDIYKLLSTQMSYEEFIKR